MIKVGLKTLNMCIDEKSMTLFYYAKDCKECKNWHHGTFVFGQTESGKIDWIQVAYMSINFFV